jgi:Uma2 family endonuclease
MNRAAESLLPVKAPPTPSSGVGSRVTFEPATVQRILMHGVSWGAYEQLLADFAESHAAHFAYDQGTLEIMVLSAEHERFADMLFLLINVIAEESDIDVGSYGSTTFRRKDLERGFEPDACFYIQNEARVRGKDQLDLAVDPPPDLVVEIDISHPSLDKFPIFAAVGVPEIWRYDGTVLTIFTLSGGKYQARQASKMLPGISVQRLTQFLEEGKTLRRTAWLRQVRQWVQRQARKNG